MLNLYVATDGLDTNPGTLASPFLTLEKARDTIRIAKYTIPQRYGAVVGATWNNNGKEGKCLSFNGISDYVDSKNGLSYDGVNFINPDGGDNSNLDITGDLTLSIWFKRTNDDAIAGLIARSAVDLKGYKLSIWNHYIYFNCGGDNWAYIRSNTTYDNDGLWHHVVGVRNNGNMYLYVDNVLQDDNWHDSTLDVATNDNLYIGANYNIGADYYFGGILDDPLIYNRALSETEIGHLYKNIFIPMNGLVRYHSFNEGTGLLVKDISGGDPGNPVTPVEATIWIRGGTYQLTETFVLNDGDSGTSSTPIIYKNYHNEEVHIIGGKLLTPANWSLLTSGAIYDRLPVSAQGHVYSIDLGDEGITDFGNLANGSALQLFFDGNPMTLVRYPNTTWEHTVAPVTEDLFHYRNDDTHPATWTDLTDIWVNGFWNYYWNPKYLKIATINTTTKLITTMTSPQYGIEVGRHYYYLNILEELDSAGEYYLDRNTGILYFWAPGDVDPATLDSYVSLLETPLITLSSCNYTTIQGLIFEYTRRQAIKATTCNHVVVNGCTVRNTGAAKDYDYNNSYVITFINSPNSGVIASTLYNLGDSGIMCLNSGDRITLTSGNNYIKNNIIHDYGLWNYSCYATVIMGVGGTIAHNLIYNSPFGAVSVEGNNHIIEFNEIHHICLEGSDQGAIYEDGDITDRGNIMRYNYIHDLIDSIGSGVHGIYLDEGYSGTQIYGNIFDSLPTSIYIHYGRDNLVANNVFVNPTRDNIYLEERLVTDPPTVTRILNDLAAVPYTSPPWSTAYPELVGILDDEPNKAKWNKFLCNVHYAPVTKLRWISFANLSLNTTYLTFTNNWEVGDPVFTDYAGKDFSFPENSPVWQLGFQRIPIEEVGPNSIYVGTAMTFDNLPTNLSDPVVVLKTNLMDGLKLYHPLGDRNGSMAVLDRSGNDNNGTLSQAGIERGAGVIGHGYVFDGVAGSYIAIPASASLTTQGARTVSFWLKTTYDTGTVIGFNGLSVYGLSFEESVGGINPKLYLSSQNWKYWNDVSSYLDGKWHHWCLVITGAGQDDIVDAVLKIDNIIIGVYSVRHDGAIEAWTTHYIGGGITSINGSMDEVMIWNRILTPDEITTLYELNIYAPINPITPPINVVVLNELTWIVDLEDYISDHIEDTLLEKSKTVTVLINTELPRPLPNTVITLDLLSDLPEHIGGMDVYSTTQQAMRHEIQYYVIVHTEKTRERAIIGSLLSTFTFGSARHELLTDISGEELVFNNLGNMDSGPSGDKTIYQSAFMLTLTVIIPYTSQLIP